jgi:hypothetical protein
MDLSVRVCIMAAHMCASAYLGCQQFESRSFRDNRASQIPEFAER